MGPTGPHTVRCSAGGKPSTLTPNPFPLNPEPGGDDQVGSRGGEDQLGLNKALAPRGQRRERKRMQRRRDGLGRVAMLTEQERLRQVDEERAGRLRELGEGVERRRGKVRGERLRCGMGWVRGFIG